MCTLQCQDHNPNRRPLTPFPSMNPRLDQLPVYLRNGRRRRNALRGCHEGEGRQCVLQAGRGGG